MSPGTARTPWLGRRPRPNPRAAAPFKIRPDSLAGHGVRVMARRAAAGALFAAFAGVCLVPSLLGLAHPSIFYDDVVRIAQLHDNGFARNLFVPINEHMQPLFQSITAMAWRLTGGRVAGLPLAMAIASALPFAASLVLVAILVSRSLGSRTTGLAAAAIFSFGSLSYFETVIWYSASSFQWSLTFALFALIAVERARAEGGGNLSRPAWWTSAFAASALAPACCGVGLLAGPAASLWWLADRRGRHDLARLARAAIPVAGTAAHLLVCFTFGYQNKISAQLHENPYRPIGLLNVYRAPIDVLLPALAGWRNIDGLLPELVVLALFLAGLGAVAWGAVRSRHRRILAVGAFLILANYGLIYGARYLPGDDRWVLRVERYHLFPQLGLTLILASALASALRRLDRRPLSGTGAALGMAVVLLALHANPLSTLAAFYRFPDQRWTLGAIDRLAETCGRLGITRGQALRSFDPIRRKWYPADRHEVIAMMPETARSAAMPDDAVRPALLAALDPRDIEALCGGMDATPYLVDASSGGRRPAPAASAVLTGLSGVTRVEGETFRVSGEGSYLEYRFDAPVADARALELPMDATSLNGPIRVSWAGEEGRWTVMRSVRWRGADGSARSDSLLPLDRLPHWQGSSITRVRIVVDEPGTFAIGAPRLVR